MFRLRLDAEKATVAVIVEGRIVRVPASASAAAAVFAAGLESLRTPSECGARAPYCMMGVCFGCLAEIDGVANRRSCMVPVRPGMKINRQVCARQVDPAA
jgi:hypothetical protein